MTPDIVELDKFAFTLPQWVALWSAMIEDAFTTLLPSLYLEKTEVELKSLTFAFKMQVNSMSMAKLQKAAPKSLANASRADLCVAVENEKIAEFTESEKENETVWKVAVEKFVAKHKPKSLPRSQPSSQPQPVEDKEEPNSFIGKILFSSKSYECLARVHACRITLALSKMDLKEHQNNAITTMIIQQ